MTADAKHLCGACGSPDTVSYWNTKAGQPTVSTNRALETVHYIYKHAYPDARICQDCGHLAPRTRPPAKQRRYRCVVHGEFFADTRPPGCYEAKCMRDVDAHTQCGRYGLALDATDDERRAYMAEETATASQTATRRSEP